MKTPTDTPTLPTLVQLAAKWQEEIDARLQEIAGEKSALTARSGKVKKQESAIAEKEKQLGEWEQSLNRKYEEVSRLVNVNRDRKEAESDKEAAAISLKQARELMRQVTEKEAQIAFEREEMKAAGLRQQKREAEYREKIKQEFSDALLKRTLGN